MTANCSDGLLTLGASTVAKLGSFLMLLAIAMDPFSQQLIQLSPDVHFSPWSNPTVAKTNQYFLGEMEATGTVSFPWNSSIGDEQYKCDVEPLMEASILNGLFNRSVGRAKDNVDMWCPTPYCRWDKFTTAGVCHKCNNITSHLKLYKNWSRFYQAAIDPSPQNYSVYFLPNGALLANIDAHLIKDKRQWWSNLSYPVDPNQLMGFGTGKRSETVSMNNTENLIWSLSAIYLDGEVPFGIPEPTRDHTSIWPFMPVTAKECALYYCGVEIASKSTNNTLSETTRELDLNRSPKSWQIAQSVLKSKLPANFVDNMEYNLTTSGISMTPLLLQDSNNHTVANFTQVAIFGISSYFQSTFQASINLTHPRILSGSFESFGSLYIEDHSAPKPKVNFGCYRDTVLPPKGNGIWNPHRTGRRDIEPQFSALANAMTAAIRNSGSYNTSDVEAEKGEVFTIYRVQWAWIVLHAISVAGGAIFLMATTLISSQENKVASYCLAWKNSSLAVMSKASELEPLFHHTDDIAALEEKATVSTATFRHKKGETEHFSRSDDRRRLGSPPV